MCLDDVLFLAGRLFSVFVVKDVRQQLAWCLDTLSCNWKFTGSVAATVALCRVLEDTEPAQLRSLEMF